MINVLVFSSGDRRGIFILRSLVILHLLHLVLSNLNYSIRVVRVILVVRTPVVFIGRRILGRSYSRLPVPYVRVIRLVLIIVLIVVVIILVLSLILVIGGLGDRLELIVPLLLNIPPLIKNPVSV